MLGNGRALSRFMQAKMCSTSRVRVVGSRKEGRVKWNPSEELAWQGIIYRYEFDYYWSFID